MKLECNNCGDLSRFTAAGEPPLLDGMEQAGDQCPMNFHPDRSCDGTLIEVPPAHDGWGCVECRTQFVDAALTYDRANCFAIPVCPQCRETSMLPRATFELELERRETRRLTAWLKRIEGGDRPCTDEFTLRQWAYEALTRGHECPEDR
jgi:hypothetical protein